VARDKDIIIKSFSAGQTNTRAEKGFRMSKLLNVELDNFGDSISSMSGLVEDYVPISEEAINNTIIKKDDFVVLFYNGYIILYLFGVDCDNALIRALSNSIDFACK
jgi:hypothetical protein